jgi:hypothetical protein
MPSQQEYDLTSLKASASYDPHKVPMQTYIYAIESKNEDLVKVIKKTLLEKIDVDNWVNSTGKANILSLAISLNDYDFAKEIIETIGLVKLEKLFQKSLGSAENTQSNFFNIVFKNANVSDFAIDYIQDKFQSRDVRYTILKTLVNKGNIAQLDKYLNYNINFLDSIKINKNLASVLIFARDIKTVKYLTDKGLNILDSLSLSNPNDDSMRVIDYLVMSNFSQISTLLVRFGSKSNFNPTQVNKMKSFVNDLVNNYTNQNNPLLTHETLPLYSKKLFYSDEMFNLIIPFINNTNIFNVEEEILSNPLNKIITSPKNQNNYNSSNLLKLNPKLVINYLDLIENKNIKLNNFTLSKIGFYISHEKKQNTLTDSHPYLDKLEMMVEKLKLDLIVAKGIDETTEVRKKLKI